MKRHIKTIIVRLEHQDGRIEDVHIVDKEIKKQVLDFIGNAELAEVNENKNKNS